MLLLYFLCKYFSNNQKSIKKVTVNVDCKRKLQYANLTEIPINFNGRQKVLQQLCSGMSGVVKSSLILQFSISITCISPHAQTPPINSAALLTNKIRITFNKIDYNKI